MGFTITHSSIEGDDAMGEKLEKLPEPRVFGTSPEERESIKADKAGKGTHFKLYDDDDNCYYTGYFFGDADSEDAFQPLEWATYDAGCTYIKYRQPNGKYETL
ncbi:MAG TPA: hypothetical protein VF905_00415 [Nitrospirota bacterium]